MDNRTFEGDDWGRSMEARRLSSPGAHGGIKVDGFGGHCSYGLLCQVIQIGFRGLDRRILVEIKEQV